MPLSLKNARSGSNYVIVLLKQFMLFLQRGGNIFENWKENHINQILFYLSLLMSRLFLGWNPMRSGEMMDLYENR